MKYSAGKFRGLQRLGNDAGVFKMVAVDQRNPILEPIKRIRGVELAPYEDVVAVKELLIKHLASRSTAILLDPLFSFPGGLPLVGSGPGLILAYEDSMLETTPLGLKSHPIPGWSMEKVRQSGADAAKVLVWYRADAPAEVREHQQAFVRAAGEACLKADLVHILEVLIYRLPDEDPAAFATSRPRLVREAVADFLSPEFNVDLFKLEPAGPLAGVADPDGPEAQATQALYDELVAEVDRPWVLLSAGASAADFKRSLVYAYRAGASGYLCGRAIWQDAFNRFPDFEGMEGVLGQTSVRYLDEINELTDRMAQAWRPGADVSFDHAGVGFPQNYAT
jgi:tagatose 1,6-diphosphate aldolase